MLNNLSSLNEEQLETVKTIDQPVRIIAGAGSGKTKTLISKIAYLINEIELKPNRICAVTFTNKAANEMRNRLQKMLGPEANSCWILTYHALCKKILREDIDKLNNGPDFEITQISDLIESNGFNSNFSILSASEQKTIIKKIYKNFGFDKLENNDIKIISFKVLDLNGKRLQKEKAAQDFDDHEVFRVSWKIYNEYQKFKKNKNVLDFDDLLFFARDLLLNNSEVKQKWQSKFDYILVDEFQDTNPIQFEIIKQLNGQKKGLTVVGDPDQTIYSWRGADVKIILDIEKVFSDCRTIILNKNYRSTENILDLANNLIAKNKNRIKKDLTSVNGQGAKPILFRSKNEANEAEWVCRKIQELKKENKYNYKDFTVLYRINRLSNKIETEMRQCGIQYQVVGGTNFYSRLEVVKIINWLKTIILHNDLALLYIIEEEKGIGPKAVEELETLANNNQLTLFELLLEKSDLIKNSLLIKLNNLITLIKNFENNVLQLEPVIFCNKIVELTKIKQFYKQKKEEHRNENIDELLNTIKEFSDQYDLKNSKTSDILQDFLEAVSLDTDVKNDEHDSNDKVQLMTIHTAKGLENKVVFLIGLNEGTFPSMRSAKSEKELEEERRLLYVATTRAEEKLFMSYSENIFNFYSGEQPAHPSRFISEFDITHYEKSEDPSLATYGFKPTSNTFNDFLTPKDSIWKIGDKIQHPIFGQGQIIKLIAANIIVQFNSPYNNKVLRGTSAVISRVD
ncbi:ATP-dependent helicase [Spiroplasma endosymbiont of Amphibalanus improvisus]|uniref:ATP-dependent helicase n=1 Tax=Spiroplasma endosymbiont of Amphibalanus improvisus TaxID=3066327 RepID=UPI00313E69C6